MKNQLNVRNFCIISHIDHGKSTLADRFLELTGTIPKTKMRPQYLDLMELEREKGITIKMQPVRMVYALDDVAYILNLIDTPGHVDFSYEVSRSLAAVEGAILLVDASQGIQAQTIYNLELARKQNLVIIPAINKIDLAQARVEETKKEISQILGIKEEEIFFISAKLGTNIDKLLEAVIKKVPPPKNDIDSPFRALIFDLKYDPFKGIIAFLRVFNGRIGEGEKIYLMSTKTEGEVKEVGYFKPYLVPEKELKVGDVGYIATGIKDLGRVRVGDTIISFKTKVQNLKLPVPLPGYQEPKPVVFVSFYPENANDFNLLKDALNKLRMTDPSFNFELEKKESLGRGYRCGFLGSLHAEIITERLKREFGLNLIISTPSVVYKIINAKGEEKLIFSPIDWPDPNLIQETQEPWVRLEVIFPRNYFGKVSEVLEKLGGEYIESKFLGETRTVIIYNAPLREIISDFYDNLKGATQGFASMNYEVLGLRSADLIKMDILIAGKKEEVFSRVVPREKAYQEGKRIVKKLKEFLPRQLFSVALQAVAEGKIIARETISARKKDVIAPLYGGDYTRKRKLLEKQKKGKKKLKERGQIHIPPDVFLKMFRSGPL